MKRLKESNSALQHTLGDKKVALAKWKEEGSSIQCTRDKETTTCKMADSLLSEIEKEKAASKRVMYQLQTDLEEVLELIAEDWRNQQRDIDLFNRINYMQGYKDREQGKKLGYLWRMMRRRRLWRIPKRRLPRMREAMSTRRVRTWRKLRKAKWFEVCPHIARRL